MSHSSYINYHKQFSTRTPCQICKDEQLQFIMNKTLQTCSTCNKRICCVCFSDHKNTCFYDNLPEERKVQLKSYGNMSTDVSDDPDENCCNCGYMRNREGRIWSILVKGNKSCQICGKDFCAFCHVGMIKKTESCKRGLRRFQENSLDEMSPNESPPSPF